MIKHDLMLGGDYYFKFVDDVMTVCTEEDLKLDDRKKKVYGPRNRKGRKLQRLIAKEIL